MMTIHWITAYLTCPGAVLRALCEHILLRILHVPVEDASYLQRNELCGHVEHKPVHTLAKACVFCLVPGVVMLLFGCALCVPAMLQLFYMGISLFSVETGKLSAMFIVCAVLYYAGVSCLCHAFPAYEDTLYLSEAYREANGAVKVLLALPVAVARAGAFLARFGVVVLLWIAATVVLFLVF